jgi:hypothetical protein
VPVDLPSSWTERSSIYHLPHGYWEAKDEKDDLAKEVQLKLEKGYPRDNIIFQAPERAILYLDKFLRVR